jgi:cobalt-precorrin 5A hydrolase
MFSHGIAIVAVTRRGVETALKIQKALAILEMSSKVYAPKKYAQEGVLSIDKKLDEFLKETYCTSSALVAVMATGITIRAVAPYLTNKLVDPAVVGVDADGKFVISLLSGHFGGANELTRLVAEGIGATAVVTTASDSLGKQSVDELARTLHLAIVNPKSLVAVNAAVVDEKRVALVLVGNVKFPTDAVQGYSVEKAENTEQALAIATATTQPP